MLTLRRAKKADSFLQSGYGAWRYSGMRTGAYLIMRGAEVVGEVTGEKGYMIQSQYRADYDGYTFYGNTLKEILETLNKYEERKGDKK